MSQHVANIMQLACQGLFANGLWNGRAPDGTLPPYATMLHFGVINNYLVGRSGDQNQTVQFDIWSLTYNEANALADLLEAAMDSHSLNSSPSMFTSTHLTRAYMPPDPDVNYHRVMLEFSVWFRP